ncbi:ABC transporter substrate-binding protein [Nocardioides sp.]|uniref:ABC transporter substrate-binding protein n=1 Tax=Nocardioides sp. TaxID=35761 RepID=UPI0039E4DBC9
MPARPIKTSRIRLGLVGALAASLLLAACGGGSEDPGTSAQTTSAPASAADRDATLRATWVVPTPPLDPHKAASENAQFPYVSLVYDRLTQMIQGDDGPELAPMVATSWEFDATGQVLTFTLRDDVTFADGTALDAAAVKASLDRALTLPDSTAKNQFSMIDSVAAPDPTTLVVSANRPAADLPYLLSSGFGSIINPKALDKADLDSAPEGSGPYVATSVTLGDGVVYERRDDYWDPDAGLAKRIELRGIPDPSTRAGGLRSGEADFTLIQPTQYDTVKGFGDAFKVVVYPGAGNVQTIRLNTRKPYLADVRVRQALNFAVDRDAISSALLDGIGTPADQPLTSIYEGHLSDPPMAYDYDPARARELLAEAGYPDGFTLKMMVANYSPLTEISQAIQDQFDEIGVKVELTPVDPVQAASMWTEGTDFDALLQVRNNYELAASVFARNLMAPNGYLGDLPAEFTSAVQAAFDPSLSEADRQATLEKASALANEQAFDVYITVSPSPTAVAANVVGADRMGRSGFQGLFDLRYVGLAPK